MVFFVTRPRLETTIYRTRGEHANHYATDAVKRETMEIAKKMREKKENDDDPRHTVETGVVEKGNRISRSRSHSQGVVEK